MAANAAKPPTSVVIDPLAMNIVNRIAPGTQQLGQMITKGGILIEGNFNGQMLVKEGPLVLMKGARLSGEIDVRGDAYIFGDVGSDDPSGTRLSVLGELHLTSSCVAKGVLRYGKLAPYEGAVVEGIVESIERPQADVIEPKAVAAPTNS